MYPNIQPQPIAPIPEQTKDNKSRLWIIICAAAAFLCLILAIVFMMDSNSKAAEIKRLKAEISGEEGGEEGGSSKSFKNPILGDLAPHLYNIIYTTSDYRRDDNYGYALSVTVRDGKIFSCSIKNVYYNLTTGIAEGSPYTGDVYDDCEINGITGDISQVLEIKNAKTNDKNVLAFLLTDGTIDYIPLRSSFSSMTFDVKGKIKVNGYVVDMNHIWIYTSDDIEGYETTFFTLSNGEITRYKDSMLRF